MILIPADETFNFPAINTPADLFKYIATYNGFQFYETDLNGVVPNELVPNYFFVDKIDLASPQPNRTGQETRFDGILFIGVPADPAIDVNESTFTEGQFNGIIAEMLSRSFYLQLQQYIKCADYEIIINNLRPLYNSNKYTKATNSTGVEINYSVWI